MNFQKIGAEVSSTQGVPLHLEAPNGMKLYAKKKPSDGKGEDTLWELTVDETEFPCELQVVSEDSTPFRQRKAELWKKRMSGKGKLRNFSEAEEEDLKTVAAGIVGWKNIIWTGDVPLEFNDSNVVEFLDGYRAAFDQANGFIGDRSNFFAEKLTS